MPTDTEDKLKIARDLRASLEKRLGDIAGIHLNVQHRGQAVLWEYGHFTGRIGVAGQVDGTVILEFPQTIGSDGDIHSISGIKTVGEIWDRLQSYMTSFGDRQGNGPVYYFRNGIPSP